MAAIGVLTLEIRVEHAQSLKDKRQWVKGLKDRLRRSFNVSVAEVDGQDTWQRSTVAAVTVSSHKIYAQQLLEEAEREAANFLGPNLVSTDIDFVE
jgi:uncharacterized protein YlxP (DUF503 family)